MNLLYHLEKNVRDFPDRVAICECANGTDRTITYSQLYKNVCGVSLSLRAGGCVAGSRVLLLLPAGIDLYVALLGCLHAGLVAVLIDPSAGIKRMRQCIKTSQIQCLIGAPKAHLLRLLIPDLLRIPCYHLSHIFPFAKKLSVEGMSCEPVNVAADAPALLTFTSGSTGAPKATVRTHAFLLAQDAALRNAIALESGEVDLVTLPVFALANLSAGVTSIIAATSMKKLGEPNHAMIKRQCEDHKVTRCSASPAFFAGLLRGEIPNFKKIYTGGAPVFPDLLQRLKDQIPQCRITAVYGSTEAEPISDFHYDDTRMDLAASQGKGLCAGIPVSEIQLKIIDDRWGETLGPWTESQLLEHEVSYGQIGEIIVAGSHVLPGYLDGIGDSETKIHINGKVWHRTGDAGYIDHERTLWLLGRCSAKLQQMNHFPILYPLMIEAMLRNLEPNRRALVLEREGKRVIVYEEGWPLSSQARSNEIVKPYGFTHFAIVKKIPLDQRHQAKVDYTALHKLLHTHLMREIP